jgi:hypothetical protein
VGRFRYVRQSLVRRGADSWFGRALLLGFCLTLSLDVSRAVEPRPASALRIAVYDAPPYGAVGADGSLSGVSVDLWRRVAEELQWQYRLIPVSTMDSVLGGLEQGRFDAAIGAITITPEREARVDFSYPAHRSGVAVALAKESGLAAFLASFSAAAEEFAGAIVLLLALLFPLGFLIWRIERPAGCAASDAGHGDQLLGRPLLGGSHNDDGRLWRQNAKDSSRALRRGCLDVVQRGADDIFIGQCGLALDCGSG